VFLAATILFASGGRTGHVILLALLLCVGFRAFPARVRLAAVLAMLVAGVLIAAASSSVRTRVMETFRDAQTSTAGKVNPYSSTEQRLELLRVGADLASRHWMLGTGWLAYSPAYHQTAVERKSPVAARPPDAGDNPHNEYLLQLGAGGLPALGLYLLWVGWPMGRALREDGRKRPWAGAVGCVALAFALNSMFNSVLLDFVEGHFDGALLAWLLVRRQEH
jgi:O-antigen ligase